MLRRRPQGQERLQGRRRHVLRGNLEDGSSGQRLVDGAQGHLRKDRIEHFADGQGPGRRVQGKGDAQKDKLLRDAKYLEEAGAYAVVLESIPQDLACDITQSLKIPTIGIGAGVGCNGQVLVIYDLLGMDLSFKPKFLKRYANLSQAIQSAIKTYAQEVREEKFPTEEHSFH